MPKHQFGASEGIRNISRISALCVNVRLAATWKLCNSPDICTFSHRFTKSLSQIVTKARAPGKRRGRVGLWTTEAAEASQINGTATSERRGRPRTIFTEGAFFEAQGWEASMSRTGNPYDNAWMESAIGKLKSEVLGNSVPADHASARQQLFIGIECW
jgi:hypothetical protein